MTSSGKCLACWQQLHYHKHSCSAIGVDDDGGGGVMVMMMMMMVLMMIIMMTKNRMMRC